MSATALRGRVLASSERDRAFYRPHSSHRRGPPPPHP